MIRKLTSDYIKAANVFLHQEAEWFGAQNYHEDDQLLADAFTSGKVPVLMAIECSVQLDIINNRLRDIGFDPEPKVMAIQAVLPSHVTSPTLVANFFHWYLAENPKYRARISSVYQKRNTISIRLHWNVSYSNGVVIECGPARKKFNAYHDYIQSDTWHNKAATLKQKIAKCQRCGSDEFLHCHHRHYRTLGNESDEDLEILCIDCHKHNHK